MYYTTLEELAHSDGYYAATEPITGNELKHWKYIDKYKNSRGDWIYVYANKKTHDKIKNARSSTESMVPKWNASADEAYRYAKQTRQEISDLQKKITQNARYKLTGNGENPYKNGGSEKEDVETLYNIRNNPEWFEQRGNYASMQAVQYQQSYDFILKSNQSKLVTTIVETVSTVKEKVNDVYESAKDTAVSTLNTAKNWISGLFTRKK